MIALNPTLKGVLSALGVVAIWSGWLVVSRFSVSSNLGALDLLLIRFSSAAFVVALALPFLLARFLRKTPTLLTRKALQPHFTGKKGGALLFCSLASGVIYVGLSFFGLQFTQAGNAGVLVNGSMPIFASLIGVLIYGDCLRWNNFLGLLLIVLGNITLLFLDHIGSVITIVCLLLASLALASHTIVAKVNQLHTLALLITTPFINLLLVLPLWFLITTLLLPSQLSQAPLSEIIFQAFYQGFLVTLVALFLTLVAIKNIDTTWFACLMGLVPCVTALLAHFILQEHLNPISLAAILFCSLGIVVFSFKKPKQTIVQAD